MDQDAAFERLREAAIEWAAGAYGQVLVDAAVQALVDGLDTPTLRTLAGATRLTADAEATQLAATVFAELALIVPERFSDDSYLEWSRAHARRFLTRGGTPAGVGRSDSTQAVDRCLMSDFLVPRR